MGVNVSKKVQSINNHYFTYLSARQKRDSKELQLITLGRCCVCQEQHRDGKGRHTLGDMSQGYVAATALPMRKSCIAGNMLYEIQLV